MFMMITALWSPSCLCLHVVAAWRLRELWSDGVRSVTSQCFQYFPCPPNPEMLRALQDNFTPYIFSSFVVGCSWRLRELRWDGRAGTGLRVNFQCFQHFPCPPKLLMLKAGHMMCWKQCKVTSHPYIFISLRLQLESKRVFTGFMVTLQCFQHFQFFQHFPCPPKLEGL